MAECRLIVGRQYDLDLLRWTGWIGESGDEYHYATYFDDCGRFKGPDADGVEPLFAAAAVADPAIVINPADEESLCEAIRAGITTPELLAEWMGVDLVEDCLVPRCGYYADDGNATVEYPDAESGDEAAASYVTDGDWGSDGGSIEVRTWRRGIDADGDSVDVEEESHTVDIPVDHSALIQSAAGRDTEICGTDPDDHDWTSEGEGGLSENPGVWAGSGTSMTVASHCRCCGLHRIENHTGSQRDPGESDTVQYRMLSDEEIARHRDNGDMDDDD